MNDEIKDDHHYAGFWIRTAAAIIDSILAMIVISPIVSAMFGDSSAAIPATPSDAWAALAELAPSMIFSAVAIIVFWLCKSATPGKMVFGIKIIDAKTGGKPSTAQLIGRYFGYYISMIPLPLMLGFIWVGIDKRKQGWHDKLAGTLVVHTSKETIDMDAHD